MNELSLLSSLGGTMGLWLGLSLLAVVDSVFAVLNIALKSLLQ